MEKILFKQRYLDSSPLETTVKRWYADFKHGCTNDDECSGHPNSAIVLENTIKLPKPVLADCKLKLREIAEELKISEGSVFINYLKNSEYYIALLVDLKEEIAQKQLQINK